MAVMKKLSDMLGGNIGNKTLKENDCCNENMTDEEIDDIAHALATTLSNTKNNTGIKSGSNTFGTLAIIFGLIGSLCSIILTLVLDNIVILFVGCFTSIIAFLFMIGLGEILQSTKSIDKNIQLIYDFLKNKKGD